MPRSQLRFMMTIPLREGYQCKAKAVGKSVQWNLFKESIGAIGYVHTLSEQEEAQSATAPWPPEMSVMVGIMLYLRWGYVRRMQGYVGLTYVGQLFDICWGKQARSYGMMASKEVRGTTQACLWTLALNACDGQCMLLCSFKPP